MAIATLVRGVLGITVAVAVTYLSFLVILTIPYFQSHVIYLHRVKLTWGQDTNQPERWGFLRNQITPFALRTLDGENLHAWHILPLGVYHRHEAELCQEPPDLMIEITNRHSFELLRDDPEALLVIYLHGAAGTLGSGYRPHSYRAISALDPSRIHILAIDYRGFGDYSTGWPSEPGLLTDALTAFTWATETAKIPSSRIVIFAQSIGMAVALKARIASLIKTYDDIKSKYHIEIIHAEDDYDIDYSHSEQLFWHAVNAASEQGTSCEDLEDFKAKQGQDLGEGGG